MVQKEIGKMFEVSVTIPLNKVLRACFHTDICDDANDYVGKLAKTMFWIVDEMFVGLVYQPVAGIGPA